MGFLRQKIQSLTSVYNRNQPAFVARICKLAGLYPVQLLPEDQILKKLYTIYSHVLIVLYFISLMSLYAELFSLLHAETVIVDEILRSFCLVMPLTLTLLRQVIIRTSPDLRKMFKNAGNVVQRVYEENDPDVVRLFEKAGQVSLLYYLCYAVASAFLCLACILEPMYDNEQVFSGNATGFLRKMPLPVWFPFDMQAHYWETFFLAILAFGILAVFQGSMDVLFFYFIRSPVIQLEILHHVLKRFNYYTGRLSVERGNVVSHIMVRKCIKMHQNVIKFVDVFNENFSNIMVLDFVQSSVRIASICAIIIITESVTVFSFGFTLIYFWIVLLREYYIYHAGNETIFLSSQLVYSVYATDWYEEDRQFKYMVAMFMVRAGKPLTIKIGPFGNLGFPALLSILQGSFSYFSLVTGMQKS